MFLAHLGRRFPFKGATDAKCQVFKRCSSNVESLRHNVKGCNLYYEKVGTGDHKILLLPGALGSVATDFQPQMEKLSRKDFTIFAWDPPGYGKSIPPEREWPIDFFHRDAEYAASLLKAVGDGSKVSVLGWSDGGITALVLAVLYPDLVNKIVVWGANAYFTKEDVALFEAIRDLDKWSPRMKAPMEKVYGMEYFKKHWNLWIDAVKRIVDERDGEIISKRINDLSHPTLIIHGTKDPMVPAFHAEFINFTIRESKRIDMKDAKHNLHLKYADRFNEYVTEFLLFGTIPEDHVLNDITI